MDPHYNFPYDYSGATDPTIDPIATTGWGQWITPGSATSQQPQVQANNVQQFPQYVSQHQQSQQAQQLQLQQQAAQQAHNVYSALNPLSTYMQQPKQPFAQKKFVQPQAPIGTFPKTSPARNFGAFGGATSSSTYGQEWVTPPLQSQQSLMGGAPNPALRSFPSKNGAAPQKPMWRQKQPQKPAQPKKFETAGKTPAMVLHEVFKQVGEEYTEVDTVPKRYRCTLTVDGRSFQMESPNKKAAKQKCAELVVRELRPDLHVTPFEEGVTAKAVPVKKDGGGQGNGQGNKRNKIQAAEMSNQPSQLKKTPASAKKPKLSPVESALSLLDLLQKLVTESEIKYNPVFEAKEIIPEVKDEVAASDDVIEAVPEVEVKQEEMPPTEEEGAKQETTEQPAADVPAVGKSKRNQKGFPKRPEIQYEMTLKFVEQNKEYKKSGVNKGNLKDAVIREALSDIFQVTGEDIKTVAKRHACNRLGADMNVIQCLQTICATMNCTLTLTAEPAEDRPLGEGKAYFMGIANIVDHNASDCSYQSKSVSLPSKQLAKEYAANEILGAYFGIDASTVARGSDNSNIQGPCSILHAMLNKQTKQRTKIVYEFKDNVPPVAGNNHTVFYCDCIIDDGDRYTGTGRSKKIAKNDAAMVALSKVFKIDFDSNRMYPMAMSNRSIIESNVSPMCKTIAEFCKREYYGMAEFNGLSTNVNAIACFVLLNERDEKRLLSIGSCPQYFVEPDLLEGAEGTSIIHFDPAIIARRGLIRVLISELSIHGNPEANPETSIFMKKDDGKFVLRPNFRLVLYSTFPPYCKYSVDDAEKKCLSIVTPMGLGPVPSDVLSMDEIREKKCLRIHGAADKIFKWNVLGVQGALLSNLIEPIFINAIYFGSRQVQGQNFGHDESLKYALVNRLPSEEPKDVIVESLPTHYQYIAASPHIWIRGIEHVEGLDLVSGRTDSGRPSRISKSEIFAAYKGLPGVDKDLADYSTAKEMSSIYQYEKKVFYGKLEAAGLGKWQTKPVELIDTFFPILFE